MHRKDGLMAFLKNEKYEVLTIDGFKDFDGFLVSDKPTIKIQFNVNSIECTIDHEFFSLDKNKWVEAGELSIGEKVRSENGEQTVHLIEASMVQSVVDLVDVKDVHSFIANGIDVHNCLYVDELAFLRPSIQSEFFTSIMPTLSTGGKCIITSTPNSDEDQFAKIWFAANKREDEFGNPTELGVNGFKAFKAIWSQHPDRDAKWESEMRAELGNDRFEREMSCEFIIDEETLIDNMVLPTLYGTDPVYKMGQVRWYKKPKKGNTYVTSLDPSLGTGGDFAAIQIFEANTTTQVGEWKHNKTAIPEQIKLLAKINEYIAEETSEPNKIYYSIENNTLGEAALVSLAEYGEHNIPGIFISERGKKRKGFTTTNKSKLAACAKFKTLIESRKMAIHSKSLISELKTFVANSGSFAAKVGEHDDLVMSSLLAVRVMQELADFDSGMSDHMTDHAEMIMPMPFYSVMY